MKKLVVLLLAALFGFAAQAQTQDSTLSGFAVQAQTQDSPNLVNQKELKAKVRIFPNPFFEKLTIDCPEKSKVFIYNSWGLLLYKEIVETSAVIKTNDSKWTAGIYMVIVIPHKEKGWLEKETVRINKTD